MANPEMVPEPKRSKEFDQLNSLMDGKNFIEGMSRYGAVHINKWPDNAIEVEVRGQDGVNTKFTVFENMDIDARAKKPAIKRHSREGGGTIKHQPLNPVFSLDDVLASFRQKEEAAE